jgi:hypothetical protein
MNKMTSPLAAAMSFKTPFSRFFWLKGDFICL